MCVCVCVWLRKSLVELFVYGVMNLSRFLAIALFFVFIGVVGPRSGVPSFPHRVCNCVAGGGGLSKDSYTTCSSILSPCTAEKFNHLTAFVRSKPCKPV